uniref:Uncharacterized protein n=1 Tax=Rhizophora mucronata TaxID=61149 RepID=A0A2P2PET2_RHIMU
MNLILQYVVLPFERTKNGLVS